MIAVTVPLLGQLSQGSIFCCGRAERYTGCQVHGFVLTARCDIEQQKFPVMNYLPVVHLSDWLERDGFDLLCGRLSAEVDGALSQFLRVNNIPESILHAQTLREVQAEFFGLADADKKTKGVAQRYDDLVTRREKLDEIRKSGAELGADLYELSDKQSAALLKELVQQKVGGYYFLQRIESDGDTGGFVVLLREVQTIPRHIAGRIASGISKEDLELIAKGIALSFDHDGFAMPIGELTSPGVEHVLQTFGMLFGRIGLEDPAPTYLEAICQRRPSRR